MTERVTVHRVTLGQFMAAVMRPKIVSRRKYLRWTQVTLAEVAGYSRQTICFLEQGRRRPCVQTVRDVCEALGIAA